MKAVILAGGLGTRISEESHLRPKPMIEIGGRPILWHIMKIYAAAGVTDFVVCLGYKGYLIKEYFANFVLHSSDVTINAVQNTVTYHQSTVEPWTITLADTGEDTMTGGRLKRAARYLTPGEAFCLTYGDGVADIDIAALIAFHKEHGRLATMTVVSPPGRYGAVSFDGDQVARFVEKPQGANAFINGGFFVLQPEVIDYIDGPETPWEGVPLERLVAQNQLMAFRHRGFWQAMDTLREKTLLEDHWASGHAPWKSWS